MGAGMAASPGRSLTDLFRSEKSGRIDPRRDHVLIGKERHDVGRPRDEGYPIRGMIFLLLTGSLITSIVLWRGLAHDPIAVRSGVSLFRIGVTIACLIAVYALCLRDLVARQRAEGI